MQLKKTTAVVSAYIGLILQGEGEGKIVKEGNRHRARQPEREHRGRPESEGAILGCESVHEEAGEREDDERAVPDHVDEADFRAGGTEAGAMYLPLG